jgi:hypothetical protein
MNSSLVTRREVIGGIVDMDHTSIVVQRAKRYEAIIREKLSARGKGMIDMLKSVRSKLPDRLYWNLCYLAVQRNQIAHNPGVKTVRDERQFVNLVNLIERDMAEMIPCHNIEELKIEDLSPPPPETKVVYIPKSGPKEVVQEIVEVQVSSTPEPVRWGIGFFFASVAFALMQGGYFSAKIVTSGWIPFFRTRTAVLEPTFAFWVLLTSGVFFAYWLLKWFFARTQTRCHLSKT